MGSQSPEGYQVVTNSLIPHFFYNNFFVISEKSGSIINLSFEFCKKFQPKEQQ